MTLSVCLPPLIDHSIGKLDNSSQKQLRSTRMTASRTQRFLFISACLFLSRSCQVHAEETIRFGIQKQQGLSSGSKCDRSILGELLKEEIWEWTHNEIESFLHDEFELGHLEQDQVAEHYVQLLSNISSHGQQMASQSPESSSATLYYESVSSLPTNSLLSCHEASSLCQHWSAPLNIHRTGARLLRSKTSFFCQTGRKNTVCIACGIATVDD